MPRKVQPRTLAVALLGVVGSAGLLGFAWYGIHLLMVEGPPIRGELWPPYLLVLGGLFLCGGIAYMCFRVLERWGVGPPLD